MGGFYHEDDSDSSLEIILSSGMDRGLAYAESCFETFRVINGDIFSWPAHQSRLQQGLAEFGISLTVRELDLLHTACLDAAARYGSDALVRLTVTGGGAGWGLVAGKRVPKAYVQAMVYHRTTDPVCLTLKDWPFPPKMRMAKFTADYSDTLRALKGCIDLNVLFGCEGYLLGAATANVLIYRQNYWCTPVIGAGVLPGIVRGYLLDTGLLKEVDCPTSWLEDCEAVALINSGFFLRPVATVLKEETGGLNYNAVHPALKHLAEALVNEPGVPEAILN
jgi:branched-subunit amino acid aminotransferase/4-amino-4-deoxychorismate lyase